MSSDPGEDDSSTNGIAAHGDRDPPASPPQPQDDLLSPLGEVQTRTRSAKKKRRQDQQKNVASNSKKRGAEDADEEGEPSKKRARVTGTTGAGSDAKAGIRRRPRIFDDDFDEEEDSSQDDEEDDEMEASGEEDDEEEQQQSDAKPPAVVVQTAPASSRSVMRGKEDGPNAAALQAPTRLEGKQLRIPAHQTPGKLPASSSAAGRMGLAGASRMDLVVHAPSRRGFDLGTSRTTTGARPTATSVTLKPPPPSAVSQAKDTRTGKQDESFPGRLRNEFLPLFVGYVLQNPVIWFAFLFFVDVRFFGTWRIAPPRSDLPQSPLIANETLLQRLAELEQINENLKQDLLLKREEIDEDLQRFIDEKSDLVTSVQSHEAMLRIMADEVTAAIREAQAHPLVHDHDLTAGQIASLDIQKLQSLVHGSVVDVSFLAAWEPLPKVEEMSCPHVGAGASTVEPSQHSREAVMAALRTKVQQLQLAATVSAIDIMNNETLEETYRKWIRDEVLEYEDEDGVVPVGSDTYDQLVERNRKMMQAITAKSAPAVEKSLQATSGPSEEAIRKIIEARMEVERADQTGRVDYASVLNGAAVIRGGERGTSPSLIDHLPVANRVAKLWSVRNHGHGPVAALTPTHPPFTALGQCWSFTEDHNPKKQSRYATLTFRLAKPVQVEAVSVEHPPQDVTDRIQTAIQNFRVVGYEFPNAEGMAWPLGSFDYRVGGDIRQEFVAKTEVKGEPIPVLQSISLLIDSNWGANYTCLYRFRVFGKAG
jgi:Sad1 / UNC-like C-terminal